MKTTGLLLVVMGVAYQAANAQITESPVDVFPKGCVIACVEFQANLSLERHGVWSRVVKINFDNQESHAIVVFSLATGGLVRYDVNFGTCKLGISQRDIASIAFALKLQYEHMTTAVFLD